MWKAKCNTSGWQLRGDKREGQFGLDIVVVHANSATCTEKKCGAKTVLSTSSTVVHSRYFRISIKCCFHLACVRNDVPEYVDSTGINITFLKKKVHVMGFASTMTM